MNDIHSRWRKHLGSAARLSMVAALLVSAVPARATLLTESVGFNIMSETRGSEPLLNFQAALPLFDSTLGTLQQVDLRYNFDLTLDVNISNRTLAPVTVDLGPTSLVIEGPRFFDRFAFNNLLASTPVDQTVDVAAGTRRTFGSITLTLPGRGAAAIGIDSAFTRTSRPLQIRNIVLRPQGNVAPFVGTGDMLLDFAAMTRLPLVLPNSGSVLSGISSSTRFTLDGSVDVTYDYIAAAVVAVPEPALPLFLGIGLVALGLVRKRKTTVWRVAASRTDCA